jgi:hypothetical protein
MVQVCCVPIHPIVRAVCVFLSHLSVCRSGSVPPHVCSRCSRAASAASAIWLYVLASLH